MARSGGRKTHKRSRRSGGGMSVEALHGAFEKLDRRVVGAIRGGVSDSELAGLIERTWSGLFQHSLSAPATRGLVEHYRAVHGAGSHAGKRRTRRMRRQRGGMAPLDWTLGQGSTAAVYGRFPVEMGVAPKAVAALDLGRFYESQVSRACDSTGGAPAPGQTGGGITDVVGLGHMPTSVPPLMSRLEVVYGTRDPLPSADPVRAAVPLQNPTPQPFDTSAVSSLSAAGQIYSPF